MKIIKLLLIFLVCSINVYAQDAELKSNESVLRAELENFNLEHPDQDVLRNLENNDNRFVGIYGYTIELLGVAEEDQIYFKDKYGVRIIGGTSDAIESDEHGNLIRTARKYAEEYNQKLIEILENKDKNSNKAIRPTFAAA